MSAQAASSEFDYIGFVERWLVEHPRSAEFEGNELSVVPSISRGKHVAVTLARPPRERYDFIKHLVNIQFDILDAGTDLDLESAAPQWMLYVAPGVTPPVIFQCVDAEVIPFTLNRFQGKTNMFQGLPFDTESDRQEALATLKRDYPVAKLDDSLRSII